RLIRLLPALACGLALAGAAAAASPRAKESSFGKFPAPTVATVRKHARAWFVAGAARDTDALRRFDAIWADDRPLLDRVARTLALGDRDAARILAVARDGAAPAPTRLPAVLTDV